MVTTDNNMEQERHNRLVDADPPFPVRPNGQEGTATATTALVLPNKPTEASGGPDADTLDDLELARGTLRAMIVQGAAAVSGAMALADSSEHPRAFEVAGQLIKSTSEIAMDLAHMQKVKQEVTGSGPAGSERSSGTQIGNAVFVGSTKELLELMKGKDTDKSSHRRALDHTVINVVSEEAEEEEENEE